MMEKMRRRINVRASGESVMRVSLMRVSFQSKELQIEEVVNMRDRGGGHSRNVV
jgi:hypothetical protein